MRVPLRLLCSTASAFLIVLAATVPGIRVHAQDAGLLTGAWSIDRDASQFPREIGFDADFVPSSRTEAGPGRRGVGGGALPALRPQGESYDAAQRRQVLTDEVRLPPTRLTIVDTPDAVTITDEQGTPRTFHPDGRAETLQIGGSSVLTTARRDGNSLVVLFAVADLRQIRYSYSREPGAPTLVVETQFLERGSGDTVRRVYATPERAPSATANAANVPGVPPATRGTTPSAAPSRPVVPRAGSEFSGLTRIGVVVEEPSTQAANCGIRRDALEEAAAQPFTAAGLKVSANSDEDTYVHVTIMTSSLPNGMCISRYDWSIYSMTEATLSHQRSPVLVQVLLAHKGGLTGSLPATHAADVIRGLGEGLQQVATLIRDANR